MTSNSGEGLAEDCAMRLPPATGLESALTFQDRPADRLTSGAWIHRSNLIACFVSLSGVTQKRRQDARPRDPVLLAPSANSTPPERKHIVLTRHICTSYIAPQRRARSPARARVGKTGSIVLRSSYSNLMTAAAYPLCPLPLVKQPGPNLWQSPNPSRSAELRLANPAATQPPRVRSRSLGHGPRDPVEMQKGIEAGPSMVPEGLLAARDSNPSVAGGRLKAWKAQI